MDMPKTNFRRFATDFLPVDIADEHVALFKRKVIQGIEMVERGR